MLPPAIADRVKKATWTERLADQNKKIYVEVLQEAQRRGLRYALGGGFAANAYTGAWRNTKDIDLFIVEGDREEFVRMVTDLGLSDYYDQKGYDRSWIYRSCRNDTIVDIIWQMANHRAAVDEIWVTSGPSIEFEGGMYRILPPEETLWTKLYVLQHERCDWPDAFNLISAIGPELDWSRLLARIGPDAPLLSAVLSVFGWICPTRANDLPVWLWDDLHLRRPAPGAPRAHFLDSRPWLVNPC